MNTKSVLTVTPRAVEQIGVLLQSREEPSMGIRIGLRTKGCSGLSYTLEFANEAGKFDEVIDCGDFKVIIDSKAVMFLLGSEMDYKDAQLSSGFTFTNPNEKGRCGCGESFHV